MRAAETGRPEFEPRRRAPLLRPPDSPPCIAIADPDRKTRKLVVGALEHAGYATLEASDGEEALRLVHDQLPGGVILEVELEGVCGYEICRQLRDTYGDGLPIVFMSGVRGESFDRVGGLLLGADDYLVKPFAGDELVARVRRLVRHRRASPRNAIADLTKRERDVLRLVAEGLDQKEIAGDLGISPKTVGTHTEHIFAKLGVHSRTRAAALAYRNGLVRPSRAA